jgi:subtilisin family serine protease
MENTISMHVAEVLEKKNVFHHSVQFLEEGTIVSVRIHRDKIVRIPRKCFSDQSIRNKSPRWMHHLTHKLHTALSDCREEWVVSLDQNCSLDELDTEGVKVHHIYNHVVNGFSCFASLQEMEALQQRHEKQIREVHRMNKVKATAKANNRTQSLGTFLKRIGKVNGSKFPISPAVHIFVMDTGILGSHPDLNVNKTLGMNFTSKNKSAWNDDNGHGTHVAGIIGAVNNNIGTMGGSPSANVIPVKVLNSKGSGSYSDIIAAINYVTDWKSKNPTIPAVLNMSLGGPPFQPLDDAINTLIDKGVIVVVAAGNESTNSSLSSPARIEKAITVGAYDVTSNTMASFSNYGPGIDIWAPGVNIDSTYLNNGYRQLSGTSMATPVVTSVVVNMLSKSEYAQYTPSQIKELMMNFAQNPKNFDKTPAVNPPIRLSRNALLSNTTQRLSVYVGNL